MGVASALAARRDRARPAASCCCSSPPRRARRRASAAAPADARRGRLRRPAARRRLRAARHAGAPAGTHRRACPAPRWRARAIASRIRVKGRQTPRRLSRGRASTRSPWPRACCSRSRRCRRARSTRASRRWSRSARSTAACATTSSPTTSSCSARSARSTREQRTALHEKVRRTAQGIARAAGAEVEVEIAEGNPITWNDPALAARACGRRSSASPARAARAGRRAALDRSPRTSPSTSSASPGCSSGSACALRASPPRDAAPNPLAGLRSSTRPRCRSACAR